MLKVKLENKSGGAGKKVVPGERLYYTKDRSRVVPEGDPEAAFLYCSGKKPVPEAELKALMPPKRSKKKAAKAKAKPRAKKG